MDSKAILAVSIFLLTYTLIIAGEKSPRHLDRPAAGLLGAVLMVVLGVLSRGEALRAIDFSTLALLFGMMVVIHYVTESGLVDRLTRSALARCRGPFQLLWVSSAAAALLSALFVNDTICVLLTPVFLAATRRLKLPAEPYLLALATSSNIGSAVTLTGNPQNMLIGQSSGWSWGAFALRMLPIGLACFAANAGIIHWLYRKRLAGLSLAADPNPSEEERPLDRRLAIKSVVVLAGMLVAFLARAPLDVVALAAAVAILILANRPPELVFARVDWSLLLFFGGLFVVVEGLTKQEGRLLNSVAPALLREPETLPGLLRFSLATTLGSNVFSNVPFVMVLRGHVAAAPHAPLLWLALAAASTLAGNLTLVGSVANLIVAEGAKREAPLSFLAFLKVGIPSTLVTLLISAAVLYLYVLLHWI